MVKRHAGEEVAADFLDRRAKNPSSLRPELAVQKGAVFAMSQGAVLREFLQGIA